MRGTHYLAVALLATAVLLALIVAPTALRTSSPAHADHIGGATYNGTHSGGGTVDFDVSADGSRITRFRATSIPGSFCTTTTQTTWSAGPAITSHSFSHVVHLGLTLHGTFPSLMAAQGTLSYHDHNPTCHSGLVTFDWTATTDATPTPSPTPSPTDSPTPSPTDSPTPPPTDTPTPPPTDTPTPPPTDTPTPPPTDTPTPPPTDTPTPPPTDTPTDTPPGQTPSPTPTPTPTPTATPVGQTPSPTPTPTATPTATPVGQSPTPTGTVGGDTATPFATSTPTDAPATQVIWGDSNCSGSADPIDSLLTLRHDAGLTTNTGDCPDFGQVVDVQNASLHPWGDVDCGGDVTPVDSLKLLRFDAGLSVSQAGNCPLIGSEAQLAD